MELEKAGTRCRSTSTGWRGRGKHELRPDQVERLLEGETEWSEASLKWLKRLQVEASFVSWAERTAWTWFVTQTFRKEYSLAACSRVYYHYLAALPFTLTPEVVLWAAELGPTGGRAHLHMLWKMSPSVSTDWRSWKERLWHDVGKAIIRPYDKGRGALPYLSKYILKRDKLTDQELADWGVWFGEGEHGRETD